jgi:LAO/AO transport system ATPase
MGLSLDELAAGLAAGERPALARALSLAERDSASAAELLEGLAERVGRAHVIGITGPPGAGKSTLVGVLARRFLQSGRRVAVLAVDPSSPVTGGALLGDRFRIGESAADDRFFVRSTATRGSLGGLTRAARQMVDLMDAAGFELIMVETVGTGQSEVDVAAIADSLLVVFPPGLGDEMQAIKAGILELADLLVVTKSDTPAALLACQALQTSAPMWRNAPPIHPVSALSGDGIAALAEAVLGRAGTAAGSRRCKGRTAPRSGEALAEAFDNLRRELATRLPFDVKALVSLQVIEGTAESRAGRMEILCCLRPDGEGFQLGAVAGAMIGLAAGMGLKCAVRNLDLPGGRMELLLERSTIPTETGP